MADFEQSNDGGALRSAGEAVGSIGLGIIVAADAVVVKKWMQYESIDSLLPVVGFGAGVVAVGVALMIADSPNKN